MAEGPTMLVTSAVPGGDEARSSQALSAPWCRKHQCAVAIGVGTREDKDQARRR